MPQDHILDEPCYFWWSDKLVRAGWVLPDDFCSGQLIIEGTGRVIVELHGTIASQTEMLTENHVFKFNMCGLTVEKSQGIFLIGIRPGETRFMVGGLSSQQLIADYCLVGSPELSRMKQVKNLKYVALDLSGLEAWLGQGSIDVVVTKRSVATRTTRQTRQVYNLHGREKLEISRRLKYVPLSKQRMYNLHLVEQVSLIHRKFLKSIEDAVAAYQQLIDFLALFVDRDKDLSWPTVGLQNLHCKVYFKRNRPSDTQIRMVDCWLLLSNLNPVFGEVFAAWISKRKELGPGIYMYLGLKRGIPVYSENRFMNMIYGLEALHRSSWSSKGDIALLAKIARILDGVKLSKDKRWLKNHLKNAHEPSLAVRLCDIFETLPLPISKQRLRNFSIRCAKLRNDISHFGTTREESGYDQFINGLLKAAAALEVLYLLKIFELIGISEPLIKGLFEHSYKSFQLKMTLWDAELLETNPMTVRPTPTFQVVIEGSEKPDEVPNEVHVEKKVQRNLP